MKNKKLRDNSNLILPSFADLKSQTSKKLVLNLNSSDTFVLRMGLLIYIYINNQVSARFTWVDSSDRPGFTEPNS